MDARQLNLSLDSDIAQTEILYREVTRFCRELGLSARQTNHLNVAAEELFTNIVKYAYESNSSHRIDINLLFERPDRITVRIEDDGRPFDPTQAESPQPACPIDERKIGGLGIHLCKKMVDEMIYRREGDRNIMILVLKLDHGAAPEKQG